jgi:hypothetical protein
VTSLPGTCIRIPFASPYNCRLQVTARTRSSLEKIGVNLRALEYELLSRNPAVTWANAKRIRLISLVQDMMPHMASNAFDEQQANSAQLRCALPVVQLRLDRQLRAPWLLASLLAPSR